MEVVTSNPANEEQLIHSLMCGRDPSRVTDWIDDALRQKLMQGLSANTDLFPSLPNKQSWSQRANNWRIPSEYLDMDIEQYILSLTRNSQDVERVIWELEQFRMRNLLPVLCTIKYLVDTMRQNNILWGVGRGSSVSSLVLFLLGVHKIDPVKWKLDATEFFK